MLNLKSAILETARWAVVLIALFSLFLMFGTNTVSTVKAEVVEEAVVAELAEMENMLKADNQMVKRLYGLDPAEYKDVILYYPNTNMMAEELLIVKLEDPAQGETVKAKAEQRLQTQKNTFEGYGVEQFAMLSDHAVIEVRGNYVLFVVNANSAAAQKAFLSAL